MMYLQLTDIRTGKYPKDLPFSNSIGYMQSIMNSLCRILKNTQDIISSNYSLCKIIELSQIL